MLRVKHLAGRYGQGETQVSVLDDVSFCVKQGEFIATVGPSESGKSTLLHLLSGMDRPTGGKVYADDEDMYALDETTLAIFRGRQTGLICQFYNLIPVLNVGENIAFSLLLDSRSADTQQLDSMVKALGLKRRLQHLPSQFSGGQQQRISIGCVLMASPIIVLTGESTENLDRANSREIVDLLKRLHDESHQTLITITHSGGIALQADWILKIEDGHIVHDEAIRR